MDVCYCYFHAKTLSSKLDGFAKGSIFFHSLKDAIAPKAVLYWIEIDELNKETLAQVTALIKKYPQASIYLFAPQPLHKPLLFKYCLYFGIKDLLDTAIDAEKLEKMLTTMLSQASSSLRTKQSADFARTLYKNISFCSYAKGTLTFASDHLQEFLGLSDKEEIAKKLPSFKTLEESLVNTSFSQAIALEDVEGNYWKCYYQLSGTPEFFILTLTPYERFSSQTLDIQLNHRFQAIEWLKDRLIESNSSKNPLSLAIITIENNQALSKSFSYLEYHEFLKAFLQKLFQACSFQGFMAQWESHSYLLAYENDSFELLEGVLELLNEELVSLTPKMTPILKTSLWEVKKLDLHHVVTFLDKIVEGSLTAEDTTPHRFKLITSAREYKSEEEEITAYMQHSMLNNTPLKLLNIYKGLCIYTGSKILKIKGDDIYLHCESLQGYAIKQTYETVIHGPLFAHEIKAKVKFINIKEKYLIINHTTYLSTSANNRQYTRVQPNIRTPIFMSHNKNTYQGELLDISLKSLAFQCRQSMAEIKKGSKVKLNLKLPNEDEDFGFIALECSGEVVHTALMDKTAAMKVVIMLCLEEESETYLMRYMYERQKELIKELKKVVKQNP